MGKLVRCEVLDMSIEHAKDRQPEVRSFFADTPEQLMQQLAMKRLKMVRVVNMEDPKPLNHVPDVTDPVVSLGEDTPILLQPPVFDDDIPQMEIPKLPVNNPVGVVNRVVSNPSQPKYKQFEVAGDKFRMDLTTGVLEKFTWVEVVNVDDYCLVQSSKTGDKQIYIQKGTLKKKDWVVQPNS